MFVSFNMHIFSRGDWGRLSQRAGEVSPVKVIKDKNP